MKFIVLFCALIALSSASVKCYKGKESEKDKLTVSDCANDTQCFFPDNNNVAANKFKDYGCGNCTGKATGCANCTGTADKPCNVFLPETVSYQCYKGNKTEDCIGVNKTCFMANKTYSGNDDTLKHGGCGKCDPKYKDSECVTCTGNKCNSAAVFFSSLFTIAAIFAWLS